MDTYTLAVYSSLLAITVASALLLTHKYMFAGTAVGVNYIGYAALFLGISIAPLLLGFTQASTYIVLFSNCTYTIAFCLLLAGITIMRGASTSFLLVSVVITAFTIVFFVHNTIIVPSVASRIETRSILVVTVCLLAAYANYSGVKHDNKRAGFLLNLTLFINAAYMAFRTMFALTEGTIADYYLASDVHKLSFVVTTITVISLSFSVFWMLTDRMINKNYRSSITDGLTGLYNRRGLTELIPKFVQAGRENDISILLADLDHFKKINDTYGHEQGDKVIKHFGRVLQKACRENDACFRYGGEEFLVILPKVKQDQAMLIADRIRSHVKNTSITEQICCSYTVSIGFTRALFDDDWSSLVNRADSALYEAKSRGRDCIVQR
ncbi:GGDEF domain-containing protein [Vibrio algarum]|uniref:diguanylate cyclase n=1 Tax=Vibrio algarum TaxID=3020714 RepID=A0ABT4YWS1_9VIBR|nr:GGDEF domain-containing protein [Vibrio sp. KJ40-1]MDB1126020.1 GGDEF domain-containing protein [Vibrio sp. KJ40-1]